MEQRLVSALTLLLLALIPIGIIKPFTSRISSPPDFFLKVRMNELTRKATNIDAPRVDNAIRGELTTAGASNGVDVQCSGRDDTTVLSAAIKSANGRWIVIGDGQICAAGDLTIPNLWIEKGGSLKPISSRTIILSGDFEAGAYQVFTNALAGQGTVSFSGNHSLRSINPLWWATNETPGITNMTGAIQAAINATAGRGKVFISQGTYLVTDTLTVPRYSGSPPAVQSMVELEGDGPFLTNIINKAGSGKPTLLINRDLVNVRGIGFWGAAGFPNDAIKISAAGRCYIENNEFFALGNGVALEQAQSVWIQKNFGSVSSGSGIIPSGAGGFSYAGSESFVYLNIPASGFVNHLVVRDNMNEGYPYKVFTNQAAGGYANDVTIDGNQFEGGPQGIYLKGVSNFSITNNYIGEGSTGYSIELDDCRGGQVGPNYIHFTSYTAKNSTVKLTNVQLTHFTGSYTTVWLIGFSGGVQFSGGQIGRLIDDTSDHAYGLSNVSASLGVPRSNYQVTAGHSEWWSNSLSIVAYPGARLGDRVWKTSPTAGASKGCVYTTAGATGSLARLTGRGPAPVVRPDYYQPVAYDFRITITTGGAVGTAVYKVEYKTAGGGSYANLVTGVTTTEVPRVIDEVLGGAFTIGWPAATYVNGDQWTLTAVVAPVCDPM